MARLEVSFKVMLTKWFYISKLCLFFGLNKVARNIVYTKKLFYLKWQQ